MSADRTPQVWCVLNQTGHQLNMNTGSIPNEIEIVWLRRISQSQPTAWEGYTRNQEAVHIFYKYGRLEVWLRRPARNARQAFKWVTIVSFHPEWLEWEIEIEQSWRATCRSGSLAVAKREAWILFEQRMVAEMRLSDPGRSDEFGRPPGRVITIGQLARWLSLRNKRLVRDQTSHSIRVELTAWTDQ
jgi:hypothetical protein